MGGGKTDHEKLENARILYENSDKTAPEACEIASVGRRKFFSQSQKNEMVLAKLKTSLALCLKDIPLMISISIC
jgi:hypothetical protein